MAIDDNKLTSRDFPQTGGYPQTASGYPQTASPTVPYGNTVPMKPQNGFIRFLKFVFVKDIAIKLMAVATAALMFVITKGFGG